MDGLNVNSYYALVWSSALSSKKDNFIEGEILHRESILPKDSRILYGNNANDISRVRVVEDFKEIKYNIHTTEQSVKFWSEVDEYDISRDIRIIVWEGADKINLKHDNYRIVSPELFELIVSTSDCLADKDNLERFEVDSDLSDKWAIYKDPIMNMRFNFLDHFEYPKDDIFKSKSKTIGIIKNINIDDTSRIYC